MPVALAVMARAPVPRFCKSRLSASVGPKRAAEIYEAVLRDTLTAFAQTGVARRVVMAAPEQDGVARLRELASDDWEVISQQGDSFGARLLHATTVLGADGHSVALVSSDTPLVPVEAVRRALSKLDERDQAVMGPSTDGGYYLLAMSRARPELLTNIPWSSASVAEVTRQRCAEIAWPLEELPESYDIDVEADLQRLVRDLHHDRTRAPHSAALLGVGSS